MRSSSSSAAAMETFIVLMQLQMIRLNGHRNRGSAQLIDLTQAR